MLGYTPENIKLSILVVICKNVTEIHDLHKFTKMSQLWVNSHKAMISQKSHRNYVNSQKSHKYEWIHINYDFTKI